MTLDTHYPIGWRFRDGSSPIGQPTAAHRARYELWCYLWCRERCDVKE